MREALFGIASTILIILIPMSSISSDGDSIPPPAALTGFQQCMKDVRSFRAQFVQKVIHSSGKAGAEGRGALLVTSDGRLRLDYVEPSGQTLIVDGRNVWLQRGDSDVVTTTPLSREPLAGAIALLLKTDSADLLKTFAVREIPAPDDKDGVRVLSLVPVSTKSAIAELLLVLAPTCPTLRRLVIVDSAGTAIRLTFEQVELNAKIPRGAFSFRQTPRHRMVRP